MKISKMLALAALVAAPLLAPIAYAEAPAAEAPASNNSAQVCAKNADEQGLKGDERDSYIADCVDQMSNAAAGNDAPAEEEAPQDEQKQ